MRSNVPFKPFMTKLYCTIFTNFRTKRSLTSR